MIDVLVIGAGWSGLTAAARLAAGGLEVTVLEKSRGPGGRSATRREAGFTFDHGAQYLTARSDAFSRQVEGWARAGLLAEWRPELAVFGKRPRDAGRRPARRWVGVGGMNVVPRRLAKGLDCRWRWEADRVEYTGEYWWVHSNGGERIAARSLLLTAPPFQSQRLLGPGCPLKGDLESIDMQPCWALMVGFERAPQVPFQGAFVNEGALSWVACNDTKPGADSGPAWVAHATADWSRDHLERSAEEVADILFGAMGQLDSRLQGQALSCRAHRWRFAMARAPLEGPILADDARRLVLAGDWCAGERVEGAWISGVAAARRLESVL